eukprot:4257581-Pyramimonas_sp.AAC.1
MPRGGGDVDGITAFLCVKLLTPTSYRACVWKDGHELLTHKVPVCQEAPYTRASLCVRRLLAHVQACVSGASLHTCKP